jgi:hypothetical protein
MGLTLAQQSDWKRVVATVADKLLAFSFAWQATGTQDFLACLPVSQGHFFGYDISATVAQKELHGHLSTTQTPTK